MFECATCGRELTSDAKFCDICGSMQPRQPAYYYHPNPADLDNIAYTAVIQLNNYLNQIPEPAKASIISAATTYWLTKSDEALRRLTQLIDSHRKKSSTQDPTS